MALSPRGSSLAPSVASRRRRGSAFFAVACRHRVAVLGERPFEGEGDRRVPCGWRKPVHEVREVVTKRRLVLGEYPIERAVEEVGGRRCRLSEEVVAEDFGLTGRFSRPRGSTERGEVETVSPQFPQLRLVIEEEPVAEPVLATGRPWERVADVVRDPVEVVVGQ